MSKGGLFAGTVLSRLLGFARDMLFAALLGASADAFLAAFRLPNVFRRLLAEGSLGLPLAAEASRLAVAGEAGGPVAEAFSRAVAFKAFFFMAALSLLAVFFARPLMFVLARGLEEAAAGQALLYLRLCLPYLPLCLFSALAFSHAASQGRFLPQAYAPSLLNVFLIMAAGLALFLFPANAAASSVALCLGLVAGAAAQALVGLRCLGGPQPGKGAFSLWRKAAQSSDAAAAEKVFLRSLPAKVLGAAPHQLHMLAALCLASLGAPGSISALYFAERLIELPLGLAGAVPSLAALPELSRLAAKERWADLSAKLGPVLSFGLFISLPAAAGLFTLAGPVTALLFGRGAFDNAMVSLTSAVLMGYALGLPALCAARALLAALHAVGAGEKALRVALVSLTPLLPAGAAMLFASVFCVSGALVRGALLGAGLGASAWCLLWLLLRRLRAAAPFLPSPLSEVMPCIRRYALVAALMGAALFFVPFSGPALLALVAFCACAWVALHAWWGSPDAAVLLNMLRGRE